MKPSDFKTYAGWREASDRQVNEGERAFCYSKDGEPLFHISQTRERKPKKRVKTTYQQAEETLNDVLEQLDLLKGLSSPLASKLKDGLAKIAAELKYELHEAREMQARIKAILKEYNNLIN